MNKLDVNKTYRTRNGELTGITVKYAPSGRFAYKSYESNGSDFCRYGYYGEYMPLDSLDHGRYTPEKGFDSYEEDLIEEEQSPKPVDTSKIEAGDFVTLRVKVSGKQYFYLNRPIIVELHDGFTTTVNSEYIVGHEPVEKPVVIKKGKKLFFGSLPCIVIAVDGDDVMIRFSSNGLAQLVNKASLTAKAPA